MISWLDELWQARHFILSTIWSEFFSRVVRSRLGLFWIVLHPLMQVAIYAFVLSAILSAKLPGLEHSAYAYPAFITAGLLAWNLFSEIISRFLGVFVENANLLKKISFPRLVLPTVLCGSALLNNSLLFLASLFIFALLGQFPGSVIAWLPLLTLTLLGLAVGLGLGLGLLNVFLRDVGQVVNIALQFGFWLTPVVYSAALLPENYRWLLYLNPLAGVVQGYQHVLVYHQAPDLVLLIYPACMAVLALIGSSILYRRSIDEVVDVL